jgi:hypothetical protein
MASPSARGFAPHLVVAALAVSVASLAAAVALLIPLPDRESEFNSPGFVVRHAWVKFAYLATEPMHDDLSPAEEDDRLRRFFELNALIAERERVAGDSSTPPDDASAAIDDAASFREERRKIENSVERILEGRLTETIDEFGLTRHIGHDIVWPPVSVEFADPPAVLVTSPRAVIRRDAERLLEGDLTLERRQALEAEAERDGETSALVVQTGGIAMYPSIIPPSADYRFVLRDIAHEWMHHYLYFTPLGRDYFRGGDLVTLNETVADIAGNEIGDYMFERYPLERPPSLVRAGAAPAARAGQDAQDLDFAAEMRALRVEVDALLAAGEIVEAEEAMEDKRRFLAENGIYIRRINQAYFAFYGSYATGPASIDPIGPKLERLRVERGTLLRFVETVREIESAGELDALLRP